MFFKTENENDKAEPKTQFWKEEKTVFLKGKNVNKKLKQQHQVWILFFCSLFLLMFNIMNILFQECIILLLLLWINLFSRYFWVLYFRVLNTSNIVIFLKEIIPQHLFLKIDQNKRIFKMNKICLHDIRISIL